MHCLVFGDHYRLATYQLKIGEKSGRPVVDREVLKFRRGQKGQPWHFVDFTRGKGTAITNEAAYGQEGVEAERKEYALDDPIMLAIKGLGQFKEFRVVSEFRSLIENWHISDFHIGDARPSAEAGYAEHLSTRGDNIAQVARYLYENHPDRFEKVLRAMKERVPGVSKVEAKPTEDGRLVLRFQDGSFNLFALHMKASEIWKRAFPASFGHGKSLGCALWSFGTMTEETVAH